MKHEYKWHKWGKYALVNFPYVKKEYDKVSRQKGYSISKALSQGRWIYTLWKLPDIWLGNFKSAYEAQEFLSEYIEANPEK